MTDNEKQINIVVLQSEVEKQIFCYLNSCKKALDSKEAVLVEGVVASSVSERGIWFNKVVCASCYDKHKHLWKDIIADMTVIDGRVLYAK